MNIDEIRKIYPILRYWCEDGCGYHYEAICPDCGETISVLFTGINKHDNFSSKKICDYFVLIDNFGDDE